MLLHEDTLSCSLSLTANKRLTIVIDSYFVEHVEEPTIYLSLYEFLCEVLVSNIKAIETRQVM